jgi:serine/threonine protein kinase/alpha-tubulin suppressor-like RCC1 family protein/uncharacterized protein YjdB
MTTPNACPRCGASLAAGARFCSRCGYDASGEQAVATEKMPGISIPVPATNASDVEVDPQAGLIDELRRATLGEFDIAGELGRGGMATVFLAHEIALDRKVAIKVMSPALLSSGKGMADRFKREARTSAKLSHPHIIPIYGVRESGRLLFFVMKYVDGRPLDAIIKEHGALPVKMVQSILSQAGSALEYAHRNGVVHRDIKPANILIDTDGWTIVTDFGIAKVRESQGLTMTGATIGTPTYMSPEQCSAKEITGATDQYSLGITAYEMLTGKVPFDADSVMSLMWQHFHEPPPPLLERRPDCPPALAQAVERMLAKKAADRWPTLEEAIEAVGTPPASDPIRQKMKAMARGGMAPEGTSPHTPLSPVPKFTTPPPTAGAPLKVKTPATPPPAAAAPTTPIPATSDISPPPLPTTPVEPITPMIASREITESPTAILASTPVPPTAPPKTSTATPPSMLPLPRGIAPPPDPPGRKTRPSARTAMPPPTVAPVPAPAERSPLKWIGLAAAVLVIGVAAWAMFGRPKTPRGPASVPGATPGAPVIAAIAVAPSPAGVAVGGSVQLSVTFKDASGTTLPSTGHAVTWTSSDDTMASVSPTGVVLARTAGIVTVTATSEGLTGTGTVMITATALPVATVDVAPAAMNVSLGDTILLSVTPKDSRGNVLSGRTVTWTSSDRTIATVSAAGTVTAVRQGLVTISATVEKKSGSAHLTVIPVAVATVSIAPPQASLQIGAKTRLSATPRDAHDHVLTGRTVRWSSSDGGIATVGVDGVVTGVAAGQATITAEAESQAAKATVTVALVPVASVTITPATLTLAVGKSGQLTAGLKDARGGAIRERDVTWTSSDPAVAGVSPAGLVTATRGGSVTITATSDGVKGAATITVPAPAAPPPAVANNPPANQPGSKAPVESQPAAVTPPPATPANPPPEAARVVVRRGVAAGGVHTCALTAAGTAACWGSNQVGQVGDATAGASSSYPVLLGGTSGVTMLAAGGNHTCGLLEGGSAICWGGNAKGQLGNGKTGGTSTPTPVVGGRVFQSLVAGERHTCGLGVDGAAWCWGDNNSGQLGNGSTRGFPTPQRVTGQIRFKALAAGSEHTCGLATDGRVYCWGDGFSGQLGRGSLESQSEPVAVDVDVKFTSIAAGGKHACAIAVAGRTFCWGANVAGEIGDGSKDERDRPVPIAGTRAFVALAAGAEHTCGLTGDGVAYCWGRNREGQLGDGTRADKQAPVKVSLSQSIQTITAGGNHSCGVTSAGVTCWGGNAKGQLGDGSAVGRLTPVTVEPGH